MSTSINVLEAWQQMNELLGRKVIVVDLNRVSSWNAPSFLDHAPQRYILLPEEVKAGRFNDLGPISNQPNAPSLTWPSDPRLQAPPENLSEQLKSLQDYHADWWNALYWLSWPTKRIVGLNKPNEIHVNLVMARLIPHSYPSRVMRYLGSSEETPVICFQYGVHASHTLSENSSSERIVPLMDKLTSLSMPLY